MKNIRLKLSFFLIVSVKYSTKGTIDSPKNIKQKMNYDRSIPKNLSD